MTTPATTPINKKVGFINAFIAATLGAVALLAWRQRRSSAASAVADLRRLLESRG